MAITDVAQGLVGLCKKGQFSDAMAQYYSDDIVSVEPMGENPEVRGIEAVNGKAAWWANTFEVHGVEIDGPYVNGDQFAVRMKLDATNKATSERSIMDEVAIYTVQDDKIVHERFYF